MDKRYVILFTHLISPIVIILGIYYSTMPFIVLTLLMFFSMRTVGSVITYHRILGHNTHKLHPIVLFICTTLGFYGSLASPIEFAASHTLHHKYVDKEGDPHPQSLGWKKMFPIFWHNSGPLGGDIRTVVRLRKNKIANFYHQYYWYLIFVPLLLLLVSTQLFLYLFLLPMCLTQLSLSLSTLNHDENGPKNMSKLFGILTGGEHNHVWHHSNPGDTSGEGWIHNIANFMAMKK